MATNATTKTHNDEWETVVEESGTLMVFDTIGDQWQGTFTGSKLIPMDNGEEFTQLRFKGDDGKIYATNAGYALKNGFEDIEPGSYVRITFVGKVDVGRPEPMKDFRVDVRK